MTSQYLTPKNKKINIFYKNIQNRREKGLKITRIFSPYSTRYVLKYCFSTGASLFFVTY